MALHARFFDGIQSRPRAVTLAVSATSLRLTPDDGTAPVIWALGDVVILDEHTRAHPARLSYRETPDARLLIETAEGWGQLRPYLKQARNHGNMMSASWGTLGMYAVLCVLVVVLAMYYIPKSAAHLEGLVPESAARSLGRQVITAHFDAPVCVAPKGEAAFRKLMTRLEGGLETPLPPYVSFVVKNGEANAFAAPGDYIIVFSGLADDVKTVDEFAGIIAHEMGHVHYSHPMRAMMRYMGFSFLMRAMVGDSTLLDAAGMINAMRFSREDEASADDFAIGTLRRAGLDAVRFADFFERHDRAEKAMIKSIQDITTDKTKDKKKGDKEGEPDMTKSEAEDALRERVPHDVLEYLSTHPASAARVEKIRKTAGDKPKDYKPALSAHEWADYKKICDKTVPLHQWLDEQDAIRERH